MSCDPHANGVPPEDVVHSLENVGGFRETYRNGTGPNPFELRTYQSSDATVGIVQNVDNVDFTVAVAGQSAEVFQTDSTATRSSNSATLTVMATMAGTAQMLTGETWKVNMCVLVCVPTVPVTDNAEQVWEIETSAGVWTEFDRYSVFTKIAISGAEQSQPFHRTKELVASMDAPRMRLLVHRTGTGTTAYYWELPRWGGVQIAEAE